MSDSHDFVRRSAEIRHLVATSDMSAALRKAMDLVRDFSSREHLDEVTVYHMTLMEIENAHRREELDFDAALTRKKKLALQLLSLVGTVESLLIEVGHA